jgi:D-alanine transaminase
MDPSVTVHLNGVRLPLAEAKISVLDRGFIFGDGVYEVIPVYSRQPFRLEAHLARLRHSLTGIRLADPLGEAAWREEITAIVAAAPWPDMGVYLQVTRGPASRDLAFPQQAAPTVLIMPMPLNPPDTALVEQGVAAITAKDNRWLRCDIKSVSLLANVLLRQQSAALDCGETLLLRDGFLTEGSSSSVFVVRDGVIEAPPPSSLILPGVTHDVVLELARLHHLPHALRPISLAALRGAEEIWLTSSPKEVLAVTRLDGVAVGDGRPGPLFRRMHAAYQAFKHTVMRGRG